CDFFKNNVRFSNTRRDMVESMTATAERISHYEMIHGKKEVESFLDAVLAIQEHIDPSIVRPKLPSNDIEAEEEEPIPQAKGPYDDVWDLDERPPEQRRTKKRKKFPPKPEKDLLLFIEEYSRE